jgi:anti-sigma B factor antagonist
MLTTGRSHFAVMTSLGGGVARLAVAGEVDLATAPSLRSSLDDALAQSGVCHLVIDLAACTYLDSAGLHVFEDTAASATQTDRRVTIAGARGVVLLVLRVVQEESDFDVVE